MDELAMELVQRLKNLLKTPPTRALRQYRLIKLLTLELTGMAILFVYLNTYLHLWSVAQLLAVSILLSLGNLNLLIKYRLQTLSAHLLILIMIFATSIGNLLVGGVGTSYFVWFCTIPLVAASILGVRALLGYTAVTILMTLLFYGYQTQPHLKTVAASLPILDLVNYLFVFLVIMTTLYSLIMENLIYEAKLEEQNYLLKADKKKFHYLSRHDSLTNLPNRAYFNTHLQQLINHAQKYGRALAIFYMDLDGFKAINDQYGHETGDKLLHITAKKLQSCFRTNDFLARIGGDEFTAVVLYQAKTKLPQTLCKRIVEDFRHPIHVDTHLLYCQISIGLAFYPADGKTADRLLSVADQAMYENKRLNKSGLLDNPSPES